MSPHDGARKKRVAALAAGSVVLALTVACESGESSAPQRTTEPSASASPTAEAPIDPTVESEVATGLDIPWGIAFEESGDALISERNTTKILRVTPEGDRSEIGDVPGVMPTDDGEGGLLGIALPPNDDDTLFAYITTESDNRVVSMSVDGDQLGEPEVVLDGIPSSLRHNGGQLLFDDEGMLYVATGDAEDLENAQDENSLGGKILRITQEGEPAEGNPFDNEVWSLGHRNVQGLAFDDEGQLWATEFGQQETDELNLIKEGENYGWPDVEGESDDDDFVAPKATWSVEDSSPSGLAITRSTAFLGALRGQRMHAVGLDGTDAAEPEDFFTEEYGRIRSVAVAPDGALWLMTSNRDGRIPPEDGDDRILRVTL